MIERRVSVNGVSLHLVDEGVGFPVMLLQGFPDSSRLWRKQIAALGDAGYRAMSA